MFQKLLNKVVFNKLVLICVSMILLAACHQKTPLETWMAELTHSMAPAGETWIIVAEGCGTCIDTYSSLIRERLNRDDIHFIISGTGGLVTMYLNCGLVPYKSYANVVFDSSGTLPHDGYVTDFGAMIKVNNNGNIISKTIINPVNFHAMMDTLKLR